MGAVGLASQENVWAGKAGKTQMKLLVVHEVSYLDKVVYEYQDFAERLAARGHSVNVVHFDEAAGGKPKSLQCSRTNVGTVHLENIPFVDLPIVKYFSARLNYQKILKRKLANNEVDVVLLYSVFVSGTSTVRLCKAAGVPVVYRLIDIYHTLRRNRGQTLPLYLGEAFIYRNADLVLALTERIADYARRVAGRGRASRVAVLNYGVDVDFFATSGRDHDAAKRHGIEPEDRVALFLGTTYSFSVLDALVERFPTMQAICPRAKLLVVGGGELDARFRQLVDSKGLTGKVVLTGFRPYSEIPSLLSLADCCFNSFTINRTTRDIIPTKILQYLAAGKPVLSTPLPDVVRTFPEDKSGIVYCDSSNPDRFARLLAELLSDDVRLSLLAANASAFVRENCSLPVQIAKLERFLIEEMDARAVGGRSL
jgi:glycosyltransferase involved in cell wall biosynthesis